MKAEYGEMRNGFGEIRLLPESIDDLWHLQHLIAPGDLVFATTFRSVDTTSDKIRPEKVEKRPVRLGVRIDRHEFSVHGARLRLTGIIEHGVDTGAFHTISVETGYEISVIKQWRPLERERIDRAVKASVYGVIHILTIEEGEAELFRLRQYGPESVITLTAGSGKGAETESRTGFFDQIIATITEITGPMIIAGPGFIKDDFVRYAKNQNCPPAGRAVIVETRRIGRGAVQEVIGKGALDKLIDDLQLSREVQMMDELLLRISRSGAVAYGRVEVGDAIGYGAAEQILIADALLRDPEIMALIEKAEAMRASVVVLSSSFEPGERLVALGGIAALLRYKLAQ
ncbi:mRNA surveillance protein pelota [Methanoregula sp.]|uniref:mRNA surveillance protein pelota n=1 Tax=Methanoregula sp. TaxID=2052170 RepID=UPI0023695E47|nr:mRNA surveillance protein pelota [Methanoregula sp.]MDD1687048.1 mRNA surveillance protein pelota [Methanoregula sp.]